MEVESNGNWYVIDNVINFWWELDKEKINLCLKRWEDINYWEKGVTKVDYPGEYDIKWVGIKSVEWENNNLNYLINYEWNNLLIIQDEYIFEEENIINVDYCYYTSNIEDVQSLVTKYDINPVTINLEV